MNRVIITIAVVLLLAGTGVYFTNDSAKKLINQNILGIFPPEDPETPTPEIWIYNIADGTGSTYVNYAIPRVTTDFISAILDQMYAQTGGRYWLSYTDRDSRNNQVLYLPVPKQIRKAEKPIRKPGETSFDFTKRIKAWEAVTINFEADSIEDLRTYQDAKTTFLVECEALLSNKVYVKSTDNQGTDLISILNASLQTLTTENTTMPVEKYVVCFSDMQQDAPHLNPKPQLGSLPSEVRLMAVNPVQGSSNKVTDQLLEIEHPNRVLEIIFYQ